jgi:hypothetical protein
MPVFASGRSRSRRRRLETTAYTRCATSPPRHGVHAAHGPCRPAWCAGRARSARRTGPQGDAGTPNPNAINSDKIDGFDANGLSRVVGFKGSVSGVGTATQAVGTLTITTPSAGYILASASVLPYSTACATPCQLGVRLVGGTDTTWNYYIDVESGGPGLGGNKRHRHAVAGIRRTGGHPYSRGQSFPFRRYRPR